ncbi:MAG: glycosyltransferase family 4 protein [Anaerolineae bacterium]|nr:glycosyltransferase family 4 protein [Anaerolineae bacterium]MDW8099607.1 glycosyltransferase family 4 protein [Anaerolineae bacterium]
MRVLLVTGEYPPMQGGVGDYTRELGIALVALGVEVHVLTAKAAAMGHLRPFRTAAEPIVHAVVPRWGWSIWRMMQETAQRLQPDVVHIQYQAAAYGMHPALNLVPTRLLQSQARPCLAVTFHDLRVPYLFPKAGPLRRWVILRLARAADAVITTNMADFRSLQAAGGIEVLDLIPIGSNIQAQPPAGYDRATWRARLGIGPEEVVLCYFGFLNASKGGETLILTLAELVRRNVPARLLMIGGQVGASDPTNMAYLKRVRNLIDYLGLTSRVHWTGYVPEEEVSAHFLAADVCVLPYRDGASFRRGSLMAALAHGLPIVTTLPGEEQPAPTAFHIPRLMDGENVLLVPPDDPSRTATAVQRLMMEPALRERIRQGASKLAEAFRWEDIAARHVDVYRALGTRRGPTNQ